MPPRKTLASLFMIEPPKQESPADGSFALTNGEYALRPLWWLLTRGYGEAGDDNGTCFVCDRPCRYAASCEACSPASEYSQCQDIALAIVDEHTSACTLCGGSYALDDDAWYVYVDCGASWIVGTLFVAARGSAMLRALKKLLTNISTPFRATYVSFRVFAEG